MLWRKMVVLVGVLALLLACGGLQGIGGGISEEQVKNGVATAQAAAQQAAPTLQALATQASAVATQSAPTLEALATQASALATQSAPTLQALATTAVDTGANVQATLDAAGIDGQYLIAKAQSLRPDEAGNVSLTVTDTELNLILQAGQLFNDGEATEPNLQGTTTTFQAGNLIINSNLTTPVQGQLRVSLLPYVVDGQLRLDVLSATLNGEGVPTAVTTPISERLTNTINGALAQLPGGVVLKEIIVTEGAMTLVAGRTEG